MGVKPFAVLAMLIASATAHAQSRTPHPIQSVPAPRDPLPRFTIAPRGGILGPVGLPLPQIGLQPPPNSIARGRRGRHGVFFPWPVMVFYVPQPVVEAVAAPTPAEKLQTFGRLILDVEPADAQVFADGYYIGVPGDFGAARGGGLLETGAHRIDVSAAGYEPMALDVRVTAGQPVTVRAALKRLPAPAVVPRTTFYLIPGCYMGNIPPHEARLPPTCDQSRVISWLP